MTATPLPPTALKRADAARYISMSESWLKTSDIPRVRLGRRTFRYLVADLEAYLKARRSHGQEAA